MTTIAAFVASMISTGVILLLVKVKRASPETMILTGVALGSLFTAGITSIQYFASSEEVAAIVFWTFGDVGRSTWSNLAIMVAVVVPVVGYFVYHSWEFNALDAGTKTAKSLGVNVEALRIRGMTLASLVTGVIISFVGLIGFVGLVAPHMVRKVIGGDERFLLPASGLVGALLLVVADTVARIVIAPVVLPVGILTAFIGAPLFIYLVLQGEEYW
jgi:iron complex transport system permease protein